MPDEKAVPERVQCLLGRIEQLTGQRECEGCARLAPALVGKLPDPAGYAAFARHRERIAQAIARVWAERGAHGASASALADAVIRAVHDAEVER